MAVITNSNSNLTLADWAKRTDPDGRVALVAELLSQSNEILEDCVYKEGNLPTGDRVVIRTGLPTAYWRSLNQGIPNSKSSTAQVDEACGMLEARSEVDKDLAMLNGNTAQFRLSEDTAFLEAMNQTQAQTLFYGNPTTEPKSFLGLAGRYSTLTGTIGTNVLDAGGSTATSQSSIFLVCWGDNTVYCPFPKGSKAGLIHEDLGEQTVYDSGNRMQAYSTRYQWKNGLVVKDWRYVVRIANIESSVLMAQTGDQATTAVDTNIVNLMARAIYKIPNMSMGRCAFYMNRKIHAGLSSMALSKTQNVLAINDGLAQFGKPHAWLSFLGVPLRKCDQLINTEAVVT